MAWPNPNEYVEALQNPQQAFGDVDLKAGKVVTNKLGLPRPISGNFATVFEVEGEGRRWAVRCFLREVTDQQQRYAAISDHLRMHALPFMVDFHYLPEGIRIRGKWYPILKMDWSPGTRLDIAIEQHLDNTDRLRALAERWIVLCRSLRHAQIAHGDLQHGNILVTDRDEIKLIDYDGMIVPDVVAMPTHEIGHRHYQHPTRETLNGIAPDNFVAVDSFSEHVIGLSMLAVSIDPSLWSKTGAGEENLLFRDADFRAPDNSRAFELLTTHEDSRIRSIGQMMLEAVYTTSYLEVRPFERNPVETRATQMRSWLVNHIAASLPPSVASTLSPVKPSSWLYDHVEQPKPAPFDFTDEFILHERISAEIEFERSIFSSVRPLRPAFALATALLHYRTYPLVIEKGTLERVYRSLQAQLVDAKTRRKVLSRHIVEADRRYQQAIRTLEATIAELSSALESSRQQEAREVARLERLIEANDLNSLPIEPGRVPGIEAAQIAALASVGVKTATDITPANEAIALFALQGIHYGSPRVDWDRLVEWRGLLEQRIAGEPHISPEDVEVVRVRHVESRLPLEDELKDAEIELSRIKIDSEMHQLTTNLHADLTAVEAEVNGVQHEMTRVAEELSRYDLITLRRLVTKMIALQTV